MRYVFADLGAYDGDSIKMFMHRDHGLPVRPIEFEIHAFEPNPRFMPDLIRLQEKYPNITQISQGVAWTEDGKTEFGLDPNELAYGSTMMQSKKTWKEGEKITLPTFDFSKWVIQYQEDYLIVKMDIEGAEFPVLEKMIEDGTDLLVNQLWIEFHQNKVPEYSTNDMIKLISRLRCPVEVWH